MFYSHCFAEAGKSHSPVVCRKKKGHFGVTQRELGLFLPELDMYFIPLRPILLSGTGFHQTQSASGKLILSVQFYQSDVR